MYESLYICMPVFLGLWSSKCDDMYISFQLAACRSLCYLVQDSNFSEQDFYDLLPMCWGLCFKLVEDVQEFDSKVCFT